MYEHTSLISHYTPPAKRSVQAVPFVELSSSRLQGVVSSGSDAKRVYVSFIEAGSGDYYCCTNNNRPCGAIPRGPCKHIQSMINEGISQFGTDAVVAYLGLEGEANTYKKAQDILAVCSGSQKKESPGVVFSRFLNYLRYCELEAKPGMVYAMGWFAS